MIMFFLLFIVGFIIILLNNNELKKENKSLKTELINKNMPPPNYNYCPNCGYKLITNDNISVSDSDTDIINDTANLQEINKFDNRINTDNSEKLIVKYKYTEREKKNNLILIVGSILIILSAIAFLTSTWNIVHNMIKTLVIILMLGVFFTISYVADKFFNLKKT